MLGKRVLAAFFMIIVVAFALWCDVAVLHDSILLHILFLIGVYFSCHEFWALCRLTNHQTFSIWGTTSACALVVVHYYSMRLACQGTCESIQYAANLSMGALVVALLGTF